jgi:hypothetical protein
MIFGQINPKATVVQQTTPFGGTTVTGSYMTALARPYALGANIVNFQVIYGNCTFDTGSGEVTNFQQIFSDNVVLSGSAISTWGEDDSVILEALAAQQGTTITAVVSGSNNQMLF